MKNTNAVAAVLYGSCAVIWSGKVVTDIIVKAYGEKPILFGLDVLCAVCWIAASVIQRKRLKRESREK